MTVDSDGELLLDHLEKNLGPMAMRWRGKENSKKPFEVFVFPGNHSPKSHSLVTFGLSAHQINVASTNAQTVRIELAICASSAYDSKMLGALLFAVGLEVFATHELADYHSIFNGSGPVLSNGNPKFEHLYLGTPLSFSPQLELCDSLTPPVKIVQIIPISSQEKEFIERNGWATFENAIRQQKIDLLAFDSRDEIRPEALI